MKYLRLIMFMLIVIFPVYVYALEYPKLHYHNAIVYNLSENEVMYSLAESEKASVASLTKILTVITSLDLIDDLNAKIIYTKDMNDLVRWDTSKAGLKIGDEVSYLDLLYASILPSGADATIALAISLSGNIQNFVNKMNENALKIGMYNSHFTNVVGLDDINNYSTASDILTLLKYALNNEIFKQVFTAKEYKLSNGLEIKSTLYTYNKKINKDFSRILGSKTGFTLNAGLCIGAYFTSKGQEFLIVTLGAIKDNNVYNLTDALSLIDFIDTNYSNKLVLSKDSYIKTLDVLGSTVKSYDIKISKDIYAYLPNDYNFNDLNIEYIGKNDISFRDEKSSKLGDINIYYKDKIIYTESVYLETHIKRDLKKIYVCFILIMIFIILCTISILKFKRKQSQSFIC